MERKTSSHTISMNNQYKKHRRNIFRALCPFLVFWMGCFGTQDAEETSSHSENFPDIGHQIYKKYCIVCHGYDGTMGANGAHNLKTSKLTLDEKILVIQKGRNTMTPFGKILKESEIQAVANYIHQWSIESGNPNTEQ